MLRIVSAAVVMVEAAVHGWSVCCEPSPASIGFAVAVVGFGCCSVAGHWANAFFSGGQDEPTV